MKAQIQGKIYNNLPFQTRDELMLFLNTGIKVCPICKKVDVDLNHINNCNYTMYNYRMESEDNFWK